MTSSVFDYSDRLSRMSPGLSANGSACGVTVLDRKFNGELHDCNIAPVLR
jgi:hypothetical protein